MSDELDCLQSKCDRFETATKTAIWQAAELAEELARLRATNAAQAEEIERLTRERDTLIEKWPLRRGLPEDMQYQVGYGWETHGRIYKTKREAVRFAAGLEEEGENG